MDTLASSAAGEELCIRPILNIRPSEDGRLLVSSSNGRKWVMEKWAKRCPQALVELTATEYAMLYELAVHAPRVLDHRLLL